MGYKTVNGTTPHTISEIEDNLDVDNSYKTVNGTTPHTIRNSFLWIIIIKRNSYKTVNGTTPHTIFDKDDLDTLKKVTKP